MEGSAPLAPAAPSSPPPVPPLGRAAGVGVRWNGAAALVTLVSQLTQIFVLARWLSPAQFGIAAAALAVTTFASGFADLGMTAALVRHHGLPPRAWASAWWATCLGGAALAVTLALLSPGLEGWLGMPGLAGLLVVSAGALPLFGTAAVFQANLQHTLRFRRLAAGDIVSAVLAVAVVIGWVLWRPGPMALVAGQVTLWGTRFCALGLLSGLRPAPRLRVGDLRPLSSFGAFQMGERSLNTAAGNLDRLLVAALLGPAATGFYTMASQIALRPIALIGPFVARTLMPLFARLQHDTPRLAVAYVRSMTLLCLVASVICAALIGLADPLLRVVLGPGWESAVAPLRVLAVLGVLLVVGNVLGNLTLALGKAGISFWTNLAVLVARVLGIVVGARYGITGVAWGVLVVTILTLPLDFILPRRWLGVEAGALVKAFWPLVPAAVAATGMWNLTAAWPAAPAVRIVAGALLGGTLFVATSWLVFRVRLRDALQELKDKLR